ncbi:MAG: sulfate reduction electron transfer complex DsrMKJOP subunit DsrJ [Vicinamibacterales bacterium]
MSDRRLIMAALVAVIAFATAPAWLALARGTSPEPPALAPPEPGSRCVMPASYMRASHMLVLAEWRQKAVRDGIRSYVAQDGSTVRISLTGTCLRCHRSKADFCDRCHLYVGVEPRCGNCHVGGPEDAEGLTRRGPRHED